MLACGLLPFNQLALNAATSRRIPAFTRRSTAASAASFPGIPNPGCVRESSPQFSVILHQSSVPAPTIDLAKRLGFRPNPELGLLSVAFVISTTLGAFFFLAFISLPFLHAFRKLALSMDTLSKVVSQEVPGTLSSLKLSGMEINDLTNQLSNIKQMISKNPYGKKERTRKTWSNGKWGNPVGD